MRLGTALAAIGLLAACHANAAPEPGRDRGGFPLPERPVAAVVSPQWSTEPERDRKREATAVMTAAGVKPGMTVADIGAGEGYYTVRLAARVGKDGRVLAEDIGRAYHDALAQRVLRERLDTVSVILGAPDDPGLPPNSFDRVFLVHMYHEVASPYALLWHLRPALKANGLLAIVDADRPTPAHGTPPGLLDCELRAVGYTLVARSDMPAAGGYLALYRATGPRPEPRAIEACPAAS